MSGKQDLDDLKSYLHWDVYTGSIDLFHYYFIRIPPDLVLPEALKWHLRLGHASKPYIIALAKNSSGLIDIKKIIEDEAISKCEACLQANSVKLSFQKSRVRADKPLQIIHADTMGPIHPVSHPNSYKFVLVLIDDFTRAALAYPMRNKTEVPECIKSFVKSMRNLIGADEKFCFLRCDRGTEFTGQNTIDILNEFGAELQLACPDTPEHNGVAERFNRTLENKVRAMMLDSGLPPTYWDLAVKAAVYIYNRTPHKSTDMKTPLSMILKNQSECLEQIRRFGCVAYVKIPRNVGTKFSPQAVRGFLVGYVKTGYIVLVPEENKLYESKHVRFSEEVTYKDVCNKIDENAKFDLEIERRENSVAREDSREEPSCVDEGEVNLETAKPKRGRPRKNKQTAKVMFFLTEPSDSLRDDCFDQELSDVKYHALLAKIQGDPQTYREAISSPEGEKWIEAIGRELSALKNKQVYSTVKRPGITKERSKPNIIDSRWVFKRKIDEEGNINFKGRLVTRGFKDRNVYDLRETYAPVSRLSLVRAFLSIVNKYSLKMQQLDVETAFLYGELDEDIFMEIPEGVAVDQQTRKDFVWKLNKSLYGLKISPKKWNDKFTSVMTRLGFDSNDIDPCLYIKKLGREGTVIVILYVDDILMASNSGKMIAETKNSLGLEFKIKDLGNPREFLGIKVNRDEKNRTIKLNQSKFINKMLQRFGFDKCRPVNTPMRTSQAMSRERRDREENEYTAEKFPNRRYREAIGSLLYLASGTRPDISFAVNLLSRHQVNPTDFEWDMVKRVFQYLSGTQSYELTFSNDSETLEAYSDASLSDCKGSLTTCGYVLRLFGNTVAWRTHKQQSIALSTCQAEYVAMSEACQELMSLHNSARIMLERDLYPMNLYCDNMSAISCAKVNGSNKLRHMVERREHYVKECVKRNFIEIKWIKSRNQLADIFTKALPSQLHDKLTIDILNLNFSQ